MPHGASPPAGAATLRASSKVHQTSPAVAAAAAAAAAAAIAAAANAAAAAAGSAPARAAAVAMCRRRHHQGAYHQGGGVLLQPRQGSVWHRPAEEALVRLQPPPRCLPTQPQRRHRGSRNAPVRPRLMALRPGTDRPEQWPHALRSTRPWPAAASGCCAAVRCRQPSRLRRHPDRHPPACGTSRAALVPCALGWQHQAARRSC
mmetsp:Transcript_16631/g.49702  ORF Transcript_16631/g.49702 Transcript_16631/m.49702 type:complete len:203 (-) Transcript_16631:1666-2274(-)